MNYTFVLVNKEHNYDCLDSSQFEMLVKVTTVDRVRTEQG